MKTLRLLSLLGIALLLSAQRPTFYGVFAGGDHVLSGDPVLSGAEAAYFMGPSLTLNPGLPWYTPDTNMLLSSGDLTGAGWISVGGPVVTATTIEDDSAVAFEYRQQTIAASSGTKFVWTVWVLKDAVVPATRFPGFYITVLGTYQFNLNTVTGATVTTGVALGASNSVSADTVGGVDYWKVTVTFTTDDALGISLNILPAWGANADLTTTSTAAVGTITVLQQQLTPGSTARDYQKTTAKQVISDFSGQGNDATLGANANIETSDGTWAVRSRNLLAPGSADFSNASFWVKGANTTVTAGQADPLGGSTAYRVQMPDSLGTSLLYANVGAGTYRFSVWAKVNSGPGIDIGLKDGTAYTAPPPDAMETVSGGEWVRYEVGLTTTIGTIPVFDNYTGYGEGGVDVILWRPQLERVPLSTTIASPFTDPAEPVMMGWDGVTDDLLTGAATLPGDWTFTTVIRPDGNTSVGLWQNGTGNQKVSLDANGKVSYTNGTDTVTSTAAVPIGLWSVVTVVNSGNTITHYLNGAVNGSAAAASATNAFTALRIGYDGSNYYDGQVGAFLVYDQAKSATQDAAIAEQLAQKMWDARALPLRGVAGVDFTVAPEVEQ